MKEAVDDVIALRAHDPRGLTRMVSVSLAVHAAAVVLVALAPYFGWMRTRPPERVLVISLGGSVGPKDAGPTTIGGRPVEQVAPEPRRPEAVKPAASKSDVMQVPAKASPAPKAPPKEAKAPPSPAPQPPTTGRQITPGNARAETGVRGMGTGLELGGGGVGGATLLSDFCCPEYLQEIVRRIRARWEERQEERGTVVVQFTIQRSGDVTDLAVVQPGRSFLLERASRVPFIGLRLPPLPPEYTPSTITLRLTFEYK